MLERAECLTRHFHINGHELTPITKHENEEMTRPSHPSFYIKYQIGFAGNISLPASQPELSISAHNLIYSKLLDDCTGEKKQEKGYFFAELVFIKYFMNCLVSKGNYSVYWPKTEIAFQEYFRYV